MDLTPGPSEHYRQTTRIIFDWMGDPERAAPKALYRLLDEAGLLLTDERRKELDRAGREEAARDIERVARSTRESLISTPPEYAGEAARHRTRAEAFERAAVIARGGSDG